MCPNPCLLVNGKRVKMDWLMYPPNTDEVICVPWKLFSKQVSLFASGFSDWKNCQRTVVDHESSKEHKNSVKEQLLQGELIPL